MNGSRHPGGAAKLALVALLLGSSAAVATGAEVASPPLRAVESFGSNPGSLEMLEYVPTGLPERAPLVVVAHGCLQTAREVAASSGWVELADRYRFALLFPQTSKGNEPMAGCFRTWQPEHQRRDAGEPLSIREMIAWMIRAYRLDERRVFVTGMSSGGLVTNVMLAAYPDLIAAGAPQSAYPYNCAERIEDLQTCCAGQRALSADEWAEIARGANPGFTGTRPRVSIWHGETDPLLLPVNLRLQMEQWTRLLGVDSVPDEVEVIAGHRRERFNDAAGNPVVETFLVHGLGHALAIDPDGTPRCGALHDYFGDADICAALWIARWFGIAR